MFFREELFDTYFINCELIQMGRDYALMIYGGSSPHIGCVVMSEARPSLTGEGISATSSVINGIGHKDESIARIFSESVAVRKNCTVVCACGIHIDNITPAQIEQVHTASRRLLENILNSI